MVEKLRWNDVRAIYPNQFVKFEVLKSHTDADKEIVDDVAVIGPVTEAEATKELLNSKDNTLVYHTSKDTVVLTIRNRIGLRRLT